MVEKRLLVLAPHTDDAELGAGGTIARLRREHWRVKVVAFATGSANRDEFMAAMNQLDIWEPDLTLHGIMVRNLPGQRQVVLDNMIGMRAWQPDMVLIPSKNDLHQDHQTVYEEGVRAFKDCTLLGYELPWNNIDFSAEAFSELSEADLTWKWNALQCYVSQAHRPYMNWEFIEGLARVHGVQIGTKYAEAFEVIRLRL